MSNRKYKKLTTTAKRLLIKAGIAHNDEFELWNNKWHLQTFCQSREESWYDEIDPWQYLYQLVQESCIDYVEIDSDWGYEEIYKKDPNLSVKDAIKVFKEIYIK